MSSIDTFITSIQSTLLNSTIGIVILLFGLVFAIAVLNWLIQLLFAKLIKQAGKTKTVWDEVILESAKSPLRLVVWTIGLSYTVELIWFDELAVTTVVTIRTLLIIFALLWFVLKFLKGIDANIDVVRSQYESRLFDQSGLRAINRLLRLTAIITAVLMAMQTLGYNISGVLAFGGVGGLVIGFAAKDLLANFFGGLMIYLDRPFDEGDWVRSPDRTIEGVVDHIGWRLTKIKTFDRCPLYVPNSMFTSIVLENPSRMSHRRIHKVIGVRYDDVAKVPTVVGKIKAMLIEHPSIDENEGVVVSLDEFSSSSVDIKIYVFAIHKELAAFQETKQDILLKIHQIIEDEGAEIAFPTRTLHVQQNDPIEAKTNI